MSIGATESFHWRQFLVTARALSTTPDEALLRTATSRAYYAAFHVARQYLVNRQKLAQGTEHERVWSAFSKPGDKRQCRQIWAWATRLRKFRVEADYRLDECEDWPRQCQTSLDLAEKTINLLDSLDGHR